MLLYVRTRLIIHLLLLFLIYDSMSELSEGRYTTRIHTIMSILRIFHIPFPAYTHTFIQLSCTILDTLTLYRTLLNYYCYQLLFNFVTLRA